MKRFAIIVSLFMSACSNEIRVFGTIDSENIISIEKLAQVSGKYDTADLLGNVVTFIGLAPLGRQAQFKSDNQCRIAYTPKFELATHLPKTVSIDILTNNVDVQMVEKDVHTDGFFVTLEDYDQEIELPASLCKICDWDENEPKKCIQKSPNVDITGKIVTAWSDKETIIVSIKASGIRFRK